MAEIMINPWLGLESYKESQPIYGRDEEIGNLSQCVLNDVDTVLYGKSGIGKTSIINAGVLPTVRLKGFVPVVIRLDHGNRLSYVDQIRESIASCVDIREVVAPKSASQQLLWELFHGNVFESGGNSVRLLVIFDQFEEIFTLQGNAARRLEFFRELSDVLNDIMPSVLVESAADGSKNEVLAEVEGFASMADIFKEGTAVIGAGEYAYVQDNEVHFVFTLREDFLSDFEYFTVKIPSLKQHRFALRPLNEEQAADIIMKPRPGLVSKDVARLIIESVTGRKDFTLGDEPEIEVDAAVLSLFLSRIYQKLRVDDTVITVQIVKQFGADIIKDFYVESIEGLTTDEVNMLEDRLLTSNGRRNNVSYADFCNSIDKRKVDELVKERKLLRTFNYGNDIRLEFIHDILCPVVRERKEMRDQLAEEQRKRRAIEVKAAKERAVNKKRTLGLVFFILVLMCLGATYFFAFRHVYSTCYASYRLQRGCPVGFCELSADEQARTPLYYKLSHIGFVHSDIITEIEVMTSNKFLPKSPRVKVYEVGECEDESNHRRMAFNKILSSVKTIRFTRDGQNRASKEEYFDENGRIVLTLNYFYTSDDVAWIRFISGKGQSLKISDEGAEQVRATWNKDGWLVGVMFYDHDGVCVSIESGVNGYLWEYGNQGMLCQYILNEYNQPSDLPYNTIIVHSMLEESVVTYAKSRNIGDYSSQLGSSGVVGPMGYHKEVTKPNGRIVLYAPDGNSAELNVEYDEKGNVVSSTITGAVNKDYPTKRIYEYKDGLLTSKVLLGVNDRPFSNRSDGIYKWTWCYSEKGDLIDESKVDVHDALVYSYSLRRNKGETVRKFFNSAKSPSFVKRVDSQEGKRRISAFFDNEGNPLNGKWFDTDDDSIQTFHKLIVEHSGDTETKTFYRYDDGVGKSVPLETATDRDGYLTSYFKKCVVYGDDKEIIRYQVFDKQDKLTKSMMYFYQNGEMIGRAVCGIDNKPVRCPEWEEEGYAYYKMYFTTINGDRYKTIKAVNEWEDVCYFYKDNTYWCTSYINYKGQTTTENFPIYYDYKQMMLVEAENISDESVPYLHILSKSCDLYRLGFCDGDRIVEFASWHRGMSERALAKAWSSCPGGVKLKVLRPVDGRRYKAIEMTLPSHSNHRDFAEFHWLALTNEELKIINQE